MERHYEWITGSDYGSDQLYKYNVRQIIVSIRLLFVIHLIENGWAHVKPILQVFDKIVLMILIPMHVLSNVASIVMGESNGISNEVHLINYFILVIPITRKLLSHYGIGPRVSKRLEQVREFYIYVVSSRLTLRLVNPIVVYDLLLICTVTLEVFELLIYVRMFSMFTEFFHGSE
ncbi:hypothetical protein LXL04_006677 [Taraxacum kok-saghyz]